MVQIVEKAPSSSEEESSEEEVKPVSLICPWKPVTTFIAQLLPFGLL
jgi:hypothetical protein